ncbi:MAG: endonuclease III [Clostridia bacterium]|nr:endonuclease III [Clostridia bacterium]
MDIKEKALFAVNALKKEYPDAICSLDASNEFELLVATRLSAQCTDARVNIVTPELFSKYKTIQDYAQADLSDVEAIVRPCGFYHTKAKDIIAMAKMIIERFDSKVPDNIEDLTSLPGVGRKTANLICGDVYGKPAVVADTHLIRISNLLGFVNTKDPYKVELKLKEILPPEESNDFCHRCVLHGRAVCIARRPQCHKCCMAEICSFKKTTETQGQ